MGPIADLPNGVRVKNEEVQYSRVAYGGGGRGYPVYVGAVGCDLNVAILS